MTIKINGKEYNFEFRSQLGVFYIYEQIFGTCYTDDVNTVSPISLDIRYSYAVLTLSNKNLDFTFDEYLNFVDEDMFAKIREYIINRIEQVSQLGQADNSVETEEDGTKKD